MVDLVIVNQEKYSYEDNLKNEIYNCISNENLSYLQNIKGGIFVLENLTSEDIEFLQYRANLSLDSSNGNIYRYLKEQEEEYLEKIKNLPFEETPRTFENIQAKREKLEDLKYLNEYGGFSQDGKEYKIRVNKDEKLNTVWCNILSNEKLGTVVSELLGGYTRYYNNRL